MKPITGTWFEFWHHQQDEGRLYNPALLSFTEAQWREKIREINEAGLDHLVLTCSALYEKAYFDTKIFPKAECGCEDPIGVMLDETDKLGMKVFLSAGFYGDWTKPEENISDPKLVARGLQAMNELSELYGNHPSVFGWYMPDETCIEGHYSEEFIRYVNTVCAEAKRLNPKNKTLIAPYGTRLVVPDAKFIGQLEQLDVDFIAYQDEIGVQKTKVEESAAFYERLKMAHDKAGRAALWADIELFEFEGQVYHSALYAASWERVRAQLEAVSPYVEKICTYEYLGMMCKPGSGAAATTPGAEQLYTSYMNWKHSAK